MTIDIQFEQLKNWADQNGIIIVDAEISNNKTPKIEIANKEDSSIDIFKKIIDLLDIKVIISSTLIFSNELFITYENAINQIEEENIKIKFNKIRNLKNKLLGYTLFIFNQGMTYSFTNHINEIDLFLEIQSAALGFIEESDDEKYIIKEIPDTKIEELGKTLVAHENYTKLKNRTQRENLAYELFSSYFREIKIHGRYGARVIVSYAETYYETVIKPKKERELREKVIELAEKGMNKVKIASTLNISKDTVNKYI